MPDWNGHPPAGRCPRCLYVRSGVNHWVLCIRPGPRPLTAERSRVLALIAYGDTPGQQWERRRLHGDWP